MWIRTARPTRRRWAARCSHTRSHGNRYRPDLRHQLPHQLHAADRGGLHRAAVLRRGSDDIRPDQRDARQRGVRRRQRRLPARHVQYDRGRRKRVCADITERGASGSDQALLFHRPAGRRRQSVRGWRYRSRHGWGPGAVHGSRWSRSGTLCSFPTATNPLTVLAQPTPFPPSKLSVFVFQDDFSLNGEHDGGVESM